MADDEQLTPEEMEKAQEVASAAGQASVTSLQQGGTREEVSKAVDEAITKRAGELQFKMSPEDRTAIVDELIERLDSLGAFQPGPAEAPAAAPEPVHAHTPEAAADAAAAALAAQPAPRKFSFAEKHFGA